MKRSLKGALLSGLLFPGVGQLWLKRPVRGIAFLLATSAFLVLLVAKIARQAMAILEKAETEGGAFDLVAIANSAHAASYDDNLTKLAYLALVACWIVSIIDAYIVGKRQDREQQGKLASEKRE